MDEGGYGAVLEKAHGALHDAAQELNSTRSPIALYGTRTLRDMSIDLSNRLYAAGFVLQQTSPLMGDIQADENRLSRELEEALEVITTMIEEIRRAVDLAD